MVQPILSNVLVEPVEVPTETTQSGFVISRDETGPARGKIVAVGQGRNNYPIVVKVGQLAYYRRGTGIQIGQNFIVDQDDILGVE